MNISSTKNTCDKIFKNITLIIQPTWTSWCILPPGHPKDFHPPPPWTGTPNRMNAKTHHLGNVSFSPSAKQNWGKVLGHAVLKEKFGGVTLGYTGQQEKKGWFGCFFLCVFLPKPAKVEKIPPTGRNWISEKLVIEQHYNLNVFTKYYSKMCFFWYQ